MSLSLSGDSDISEPNSESLFAIGELQTFSLHCYKQVFETPLVLLGDKSEIGNTSLFKL